MPKNEKQAFNDLIKDLKSLPDELVETIINTDKELLKKIKTTHKKEQDPFGKAWKPRKSDGLSSREDKEATWPILNKTGNLLDSYKAFKKSNNKLLITNEAEYAAAVNVKRQLLPDKEIPDAWFKEIEKAIDEYIKNFNEG